MSDTDSSKRKIPRVVSIAALVVGLVAGGYGISSAATGSGSDVTPTPAVTKAAPSAGFQSNEDPAHEAGESAAQEAAEHAGTFGGGRNGPNEDPAHEAGESAAKEAAEHAGGRHGSNDDPAHEAGESAAREAQEHAGAATPAPAATPGTSGGTTNQ